VASNLRSDRPITFPGDTLTARQQRHDARVEDRRRHASPPAAIAAMEADAHRRFEERTALRQTHDREQTNRRGVRARTTITGDQWRLSGERLVAYMALTEQDREGVHRANVRLKEAFARYVDGQTMGRAIRQLCALYPQLGEVVVALYPLDEELRPRTQAELGERLNLSQSAVSKRLRKALTYLGGLYEGLDDAPSVVDAYDDESGADFDPDSERRWWPRHGRARVETDSDAAVS